MLFADGFWEVKSLADLVTVVGFAATIFSIWYAWYLAKRDIEKRIRDAQEQTIQRLARSLLQPEITETARCLREARDACRSKRWDRVLDRCEQVQHRIPTFISLPGLDDDDRRKLRKAVDQLRLIVQQLEEITTGRKRTELSSTKVKELDSLITTLATIEGKLRASGLR